MCGEERRETTITSEDWECHLNFRTSKCAFLTMRMGGYLGNPEAICQL